MNVIQSIELVTSEVQEGKLPRNKYRNICHRIRENRLHDQWEQDRAPAVKFIIEKQFRKVKTGENGNGEAIMTAMSWSNFTIVWDIHPKNILMIITPDQWQHEGGEYDSKMEILKPTAFTHQMVD